MSVRATGASLRNEAPALGEADLLLLERLSHGVTEEMIGWELRRPVETVRENIGAVVSALGARNLEHAVAIALRTGLIR
jgi:DNA-binding NarL/FixJ family response regulator